MDGVLREFVRQRAANRCEYCRLPQHAEVAAFHVEHIIAIQHSLRDPDDLSNLALACNRCNLYKGPNLSGIDPATEQIVQLFHPRLNIWDEHFEWDGVSIVGLTATGRATIRLLQMNATRRLELRRLLLQLNELYD